MWEWLTQSTLLVVGGFFGGALWSSTLDWIRSASAERASRNAQYLSEQLRLLYGPVYFLYSQNQELGRVGDMHRKAYAEVYEGKSWEGDAITQETLDAINVGNRYTSRIIENNDKISEILRQNYGLIDPDDAEVFQEIVTHAVRYKFECCEEPHPPGRIRLKLGPIHFLRSDHFEVLQSRFASKMAELRRLRELSLPSWLAKSTGRPDLRAGGRGQGA